MAELFPGLVAPRSGLALRIDDEAWTYEMLAEAAVAHRDSLAEFGVAEGDRVAVWAHPTHGTAAAIVGNLAAGAVTILLSPKLGSDEVSHIGNDARPSLVFSDRGQPRPLADVAVMERHYAPGATRPRTPLEIRIDDHPALVLYTSGTTGAPKGVAISRRNIAANLDALASIWEWTARDTVVHALPLIHVHGLVLGLFGSLRVGGALHYLPQFSPEGIAAALVDPEHDQTILFAVPTMIHRLADSAESDPVIARALARPRLLISGSAGLPTREHARVQKLTGRGVHERYGLTETLINCGVPAAHVPAPGFVGPPLPGVELRLVDEDRHAIDAHDDATIGEVAVRSAAVFAGYLDREEATAEVLDGDGWFYTGDLATRAADGFIRILGRRSTDLIKTGGYRVGAGEIEACLLNHPGVSEAAVIGAPDSDLGQRIVAFVVLRSGARVLTTSLDDFVRERLSRHKCPREIRIIGQLPRNAMGKVQKKQLLEGEERYR